MGGALLLLCLANVYLYLIKQSKYKHGLSVCFYITAILTVVANVYIVWQGADYYCSPSKNFVYMAIPYLTLLMGICQAGQISVLAVQLDQLLATKDEVLGMGGAQFPTLAERLGTLKRRKRRIYAGIALLLSLTAVLLVVDHHMIQGTLACPPPQTGTEREKAMERAYRGYLVHKALWAAPAIFTLVWLTVPAC